MRSYIRFMTPPYRDSRRNRTHLLHLHARRKRFFLLQKPLLFLLRQILHLWPVEVRGEENIPPGGAIIACSHHNSLDPFVLAFAAKITRIRFLAKSQLFHFPYTWPLLFVGAFPIRRGEDDKEAFETARVVLERGQYLVVYPQGAVYDTLEEAPARWGAGYIAQISGASVLPVRLEGSGDLLRFRKITITIGQPFAFQRERDPSKESNQRVADAILEKIAEL